MFRDQEFTIASLPPNEVYLVVSCRGPEVERVAVGHGEHGQVIVDYKRHGPDVALWTGESTI